MHFSLSKEQQQNQKKRKCVFLVCHVWALIRGEVFSAAAATFALAYDQLRRGRLAFDGSRLAFQVGIQTARADIGEVLASVPPAYTFASSFIYTEARHEVYAAHEGGCDLPASELSSPLCVRHVLLPLEASAPCAPVALTIAVGAMCYCP